LSVGIFKFDGFIEFKDGVNIGLGFGSKYGNFIVTFEKIKEIISENMGGYFLPLSHLVALLNQGH